MSDTRDPYPSHGTAVLAVPEASTDSSEQPTRPIFALKHGWNGRAPSTQNLSTHSHLPEVPGYKVVQRSGRGGMGIVYRALDLSLNRPVALKMLGGTTFEIDREAMTRFQKEAEALASLRHPNIVPVYEVGECNGLPYFTMELVEGGDLASRIMTRPLAPTEAARLAAQLARGVQAAHESGILHRDLKPSNILLALPGTSGEPIAKIADFGLAKKFGAARGTERTMTEAGYIMGTPSYMAPEQAEGSGMSHVGPASDIYSIGAILYEMITRQPPFEADDPVRTVLRVLNEEAIPPSRFVTGVPRDLETICLKCLQKDPRKRYPTAQALADDLDRFLGGLPIAARPVSATERAWKWAKRRPGTVGLLATTCLGFVIAFVGITAMWARAGERANRLQEANREADRQRQALQENQEELEYRVARGYLERGVSACHEGDVPRGLAFLVETIDRAERHARRVEGLGTADRFAELSRVARTNIARWAVRVPLRKRARLGASDGRGERHWVSDIDLSPDGKVAVTGSGSGRLRFFDAETSAELGDPLLLDGYIGQIAFSPDGRTLLALRTVDDRTRAQLVDVATRTCLGPEVPLRGCELTLAIFPGEQEYVNAVFLGSDRLIVHADGGVLRIIRAGTNEDAGPTILADVPITAFIPTEDGRYLYTGHKDGSVRAWDLQTGEQRARTAPGGAFVVGLSLRPDGGRVLAVSCQGVAQEFHPRSLEPIDDPFGPGVDLSANQRCFVFAADYNRDGSRIGFSGGFWSREPKGRVGFAQVWRSDRHALEREFQYETPIWSLAFSGDGATLALAEEQVRIHLVSVQDGTHLYTHEQSGNPARVLIGRDGRTLLAAERGDKPAPLLADIGPGRLAGPPIGGEGDVRGLGFDTQGRLTVFWNGGQSRAFDVRTGEPAGRKKGVGDSLGWMRARGDGRVGLAGRDPNYGEEHEIAIWDMTARQRIGTANGGRFIGASFFPRRDALIAHPIWSTDLIAFDFAGNPLWKQTVDKPIVPHHPLCAGVMADERSVLAGVYLARELRRLDTATGRFIGDPIPLPGRLFSLVPHPDSNRVTLVFAEGYLRTFDGDTLRPIGLPIPWSGIGIDPVVSPDGRTLAVATNEGRVGHVAFYDTMTGLAVAPPILTGPDTIKQVAFDPAGRLAAIAQTSGLVRTFELPEPVAGTADQVRCWVESVSRRQFAAEPAETMTHLDDAAVGDRRKRLRLEWPDWRPERTSGVNPAPELLPR